MERETCESNMSRDSAKQLATCTSHRGLETLIFKRKLVAHATFYMMEFPFPKLSGNEFPLNFHILFTRYTLCSVSEDMQYKSGTSSVQTRMCSMGKAHHQYKPGCAVRVRHIFSRSEDKQYESSTSSAWVRMYSTNQAHHQYEQVDHQVLVQGGTTQKLFPMNKSLLFG